MSENKMFGYARVSSKDQNEARQRKELLDFGVNDRDIFVDKISGKNFERAEYQALRNHMLRKGDILVIKSIDRFGRNYQDLLDVWKYIVKEIGADIVVLDMQLLDTRRNKDLLGTLISDIVLTLLSYVAENERDAIRQREGIVIVGSKGVKFDRNENTYPSAWEELYGKWQAGEITAVEFYTALEITKSSFYDMVKRYDPQKYVVCLFGG